MRNENLMFHRRFVPLVKRANDRGVNVYSRTRFLQWIRNSRDPKVNGAEVVARYFLDHENREEWIADALEL